MSFRPLRTSTPAVSRSSTPLQDEPLNLSTEGRDTSVMVGSPPRLHHLVASAPIADVQPEAPTTSKKRKGPTLREQVAKRVRAAAFVIPPHRPGFEARPRDQRGPQHLCQQFSQQRLIREFLRQHPTVMPVVADSSTQTEFNVVVPIDPVPGVGSHFITPSQVYIPLRRRQPRPPFSNTSATAIEISSDEEDDPLPKLVIVEKSPGRESEGEE